jgi:release factor glutamine methyltransferase
VHSTVASHPRSGPIATAWDIAAARLERAGVGNGSREARGLWAAVAGITPGEAWLRRGEPVPEATAAPFWRAVERRASGAPFAYAAGRLAFRTLDLSIDRRALIPRPETEGLVDLVLRWARETGTGGGVVADVCTGSGCIALSLAVEGTFDRVVAVESSAGAAALARENVAAVRPPVPVDVREGDLLGPLAGERYRAIVANPPYLTLEEYAILDAAVRAFEPREALVSGADGLDATRALIAGARALLEPGGLLALEIDERRAAQVLALTSTGSWSRAVVCDDLFGRPRYALAIATEGNDA